MTKCMSSIHQFYTTRRRVWLKWRKLSPTAFWSRSASSCRTAPEVLHPDERKGASCNQVTKTPHKQRSSCLPVLEHFDQQYSQELGDLWESARSVLLDPQSWQYGVLLNRFSILADLPQTLRSQGFSLLPLTDGCKFFSPDLSAVSSPQKRAGGDSQDIPRDPIEDSRLRPSSADVALDRDLQLEPSFRLTRPPLRCYINPRPVRFPSQPHWPGQLKQYYLLNAASLLPVLALQVRDGEKVLDLCAAPGGKAVAIMQCATPALLCCNEPDPHRRGWLARTLESFLPSPLSSRVTVSAQDGRSFGQREEAAYDKVLVDAPCSNDRSWLYSRDSQQGAQRLKERAKLSALQVQLLRSALSTVRPGGVVVYSTCTLSRSENYGVVETVLNDCPEAEPEDLWKELALPLSGCFSFTRSGCGGETLASTSSYRHRLGILAFPQPGKTWGPMFVSRIRRRE
ncbi:tRNA (cytosine(34)-C(5))-methyltransferase, mitochondrial [Brachionichthys hirsutus]|uniref:tRNA (cytosine(34)-C(5))-methyltransferase, mitochondrial n=1 Tax=Brachionichthys hirsutus TaxID=412623 RepID=UPI0036047FC3